MPSYNCVLHIFIQFCSNWTGQKKNSSSVYSFFVLCHLDRHHHPVMKLQRRRKRKNKAGPTPLPMRGEKRSWKATKRRARNTKRNMRKAKRRSRRRGNKNHLPPPPPPPRPAPANPQTVTETRWWHRAQGIALLSFFPWTRWFADIVGKWHPTLSGTSVIYKNRDLQRRRGSSSWHRDESEKCFGEGAQSQGTCSDILFHFPSRLTVTSHLVVVVCRQIFGGRGALAEQLMEKSCRCRFPHAVLLSFGSSFTFIIVFYWIGPCEREKKIAQTIRLFL